MIKEWIETIKKLDNEHDFQSRNEYAFGVVKKLLSVFDPSRLADIVDAGPDKVKIMPCKVGDRVWLLLERLNGYWDVMSSFLVAYIDRGCGGIYQCYLAEAPDKCLEYEVSDFEEKVFLSPEAALNFMKKSRKKRSNRHYVAVSIKHSEYDTRDGRFVLWGDHRTGDGQERCFSGYTYDIERCEIYSMDDFRVDHVKHDAAVHVGPAMCKIWKKYDSVLVDFNEYVQYLRSLRAVALEGADKDER